MRMKIALYARVSTTEQTTINQVDQLATFARAQKWEVVQQFEDVASGGRADRAQFQAMMAAAAQRRFDLVLFWSLDRFSREGVAETLRYLQLLNSWGVGFRSFTEPYLDSLGIFKDAVIGLLATLAKQERVRLSERTKAGLARARARGRLPGRPRKFDERIRIEVRRLRRGRDPVSFPEIARRLKISVGTAHRLAQ